MFRTTDYEPPVLLFDWGATTLLASTLEELLTTPVPLLDASSCTRAKKVGVMVSTKHWRKEEIDEEERQERLEGRKLQQSGKAQRGEGKTVAGVSETSTK